jgi:hypothetical protein
MAFGDWLFDGWHIGVLGTFATDVTFVTIVIKIK